MIHGISIAHVDVQDRKAIRGLTASLPSSVGRAVKELVRLSGRSGMHFDADTLCAFWLQNSDGTLTCVAFGEIANESMAGKLHLELETAKPQTTDELRDIYERLTRIPAGPIGKRH